MTSHEAARQGVKRSLQGVVCLVLGVLLALAVPDSPRAQEPAASCATTPVVREKLNRLYFGVSACSTGGCHLQAQIVSDAETIFYRGIEQHFWNSYDKHK